MIKVKITKLERIIGRKLKRNQTVLGVDTAGKTGWAIISVNHDTTLIIDTGIISLEKIKNHNERFDYLLNFFGEIAKKHMAVVIEEPFVGCNRQTSLLLAKYSAIIYAIARFKGIERENITFITATSARKRVGIRGKQKKKEGAIKFVHRFIPNLKSNDVSDGIILALVGLIQEPNLKEYLK